MRKDSLNPGDILTLSPSAIDGFRSRLREVSLKWTGKEITAEGKFFYLSFRDGKPTVNEFIDYIYNQIIPFCIPAKEILETAKKFEETKDTALWLRLGDKARNLFIKAKNEKVTTGEPGELILYIILEAALLAPQVACKMYLKTSEMMPVHGADSMHMKYDNVFSVLTLYWGESKLYKQLSAALDEIMKSISAFVSPAGGRSPKERDIDIIKDHISLPSITEDFKKALLEYFDPYSESSNLLREFHACFAGFDYDVYSDLSKISKNKLAQHFQNKYFSRIESACSLFEHKIKESGLNHLGFYLFLLPFPSVEELRKKFLKKLGVVSD